MHELLKESLELSRALMMQCSRRYGFEMSQITFFNLSHTLTEETKLYLSCIKDIVSSGYPSRFPWDELKKMTSTVNKSDVTLSSSLSFLSDAIKYVADNPDFNRLNYDTRAAVDENKVKIWAPLFLSKMKPHRIDLQCLTMQNGSRRWLATIPKLSQGRLVYLGAKMELLGSSNQSLTEKKISISSYSANQAQSAFFEEAKQPGSLIPPLQNFDEVKRVSWAMTPLVDAFTLSINNQIILSYLNKLTEPTREPCIANSWRGRLC